MTAKQKSESTLVFAGFLYGFFGVLSKLINFQIPFFYQMWVRTGFSFIFIVILALYFKKWKKIAKKDYVWFFLRGICGFVSFIAIFVAFTGLSIGTTYFLSYASTVIAGYIFGLTLFKERITKNSILCLLLALSGLLLVYKLSISATTFMYLLLAIVSGIAGPGWEIFSKKISSTYSNIQIQVIDSLFATTLPLLVFLFSHEQWVPITLSSVWIYTFLFGLMFLSTSFLIVYGFKRVSAQAGTILLLVEIISGIFFGYLFFHEVLSLYSYIGGALIFSAVILRTFEKEVI